MWIIRMFHVLNGLPCSVRYLLLFFGLYLVAVVGQLKCAKSSKMEIFLRSILYVGIATAFIFVVSETPTLAVCVQMLMLGTMRRYFDYFNCSLTIRVVIVCLYIYQQWHQLLVIFNYFWLIYYIYVFVLQYFFYLIPMYFGTSLLFNVNKAVYDLYEWCNENLNKLMIYIVNNLLPHLNLMIIILVCIMAVYVLFLN